MMTDYAPVNDVPVSKNATIIGSAMHSLPSIEKAARNGAKTSMEMMYKTTTINKRGST